MFTCTTPSPTVRKQPSNTIWGYQQTFSSFERHRHDFCHSAVPTLFNVSCCQSPIHSTVYKHTRTYSIPRHIIMYVCTYVLSCAWIYSPKMMESFSNQIHYDSKKNKVTAHSAERMCFDTKWLCSSILGLAEHVIRSITVISLLSVCRPTDIKKE